MQSWKSFLRSSLPLFLSVAPLFPLLFFPLALALFFPFVSFIRNQNRLATHSVNITLSTTKTSPNPFSWPHWPWPKKVCYTMSCDEIARRIEMK